MKKYDYFINNELVSRKEFFLELRNQSQKVIHTEVIAGWCGVNLMGFDEKKYKERVRDINKGYHVIILSEKANKTFKRRERK